MKRQYPLVDLWKFIFAFAVISLHAKPFVGLPNIVQWYIEALFTRLAVPFFFVSSSFFLSLKIRQYGYAVFKPYRIALLPKLLFWGSIALALMFYPTYQESQSIGSTLLYLAKNAVFYPRGSMWFMLALIISSIMLEVALRKKFKIPTVIILSLVLYVFALLCVTYFFTVDGTILGKVVNLYMRICISPSNGVLLFIFMAIGYGMSSDKVMQFSKRTIIIVFGIGIVFMILESVLLFGKSEQGYYFISHLILIPSMILLMTKSNASVPSHKVLREISVVLFCSHSFFSRILGSYFGIEYGIIRFVITVTLSMLLWVITRNTKKKVIRKLLY